jgi:hypothetical protein
MVYSRAEHDFILEHYSHRNHNNNAYPDKGVPNEVTSHQLVTNFRDTGSVCVWKALVERKDSWNFRRAGFRQYISCNNGIRLRELNTAFGFVVLCMKVFKYSSLRVKWNILCKCLLETCKITAPLTLNWARSKSSHVSNFTCALWNLVQSFGTACAWRTHGSGGWFFS